VLFIIRESFGAQCASNRKDERKPNSKIFKKKEKALGYKTLLTKRVEFSASHCYWNPKWNEEVNKSVFGKCTSPYGHGHNYVLEVTIEGNVDTDTGMIINLYDLKPIISEILKDFDHKFLNEDNSYFKDLIPTTENISRVLWNLLEKRLRETADCRLYRVRLYETQDLYVDYWRE
jgi:6-pyruvoyltetrahydropterin/6-carboxytetrahydropterin synthase